MDIIASLLDIESELTLYLFTATPTTAEEQAAMAQILALRDRLYKNVNEIVLHRAELAALGLREHEKSLGGLCERIKATTETIDKVKEVIGTITEVMHIAGSIVASIPK